MRQTRDLTKEEDAQGRATTKAVLLKCYPLVRSVFRFYCNSADGNNDQSMVGLVQFESSGPIAGKHLVSTLAPEMCDLLVYICFRIQLVPLHRV
jgi:hypothetical protein